MAVARSCRSCGAPLLEGDPRDRCLVDDPLSPTEDVAVPPPVLGVQAATSPLAASESPGARIGRYRIIRLLGEGGFGTVFLAEQEHPVSMDPASKSRCSAVNSSEK